MSQVSQESETKKLFVFNSRTMMKIRPEHPTWTTLRNRRFWSRHFISMTRNIFNLLRVTQNLQELKVHLQEEWEKIPESSTERIFLNFCLLQGFYLFLSKLCNCFPFSAHVLFIIWYNVSPTSSEQGASSRHVCFASSVRTLNLMISHAYIVDA